MFCMIMMAQAAVVSTSRIEELYWIRAHGEFKWSTLASWLTAASSSSSLYFFPWSIIDSHGSAAGLHLNDDNVKVHSNITFLCGHSGQYKQPVYVTLQQSSLEGCFIIPIFWKLVYKVISFIYSNATSAHNTSAKLSLRHPSITCVAVASFDNGLPETSRTLFSLTCSSYSK